MSIIINMYIFYQVLQTTVFPNKLKLFLDSRSSKLETFTRPKKILQTVGGQCPILTL